MEYSFGPSAALHRLVLILYIFWFLSNRQPFFTKSPFLTCAKKRCQPGAKLHHGVQVHPLRKIEKQWSCLNFHHIYILMTQLYAPTRQIYPLQFALASPLGTNMSWNPISIRQSFIIVDRVIWANWDSWLKITSACASKNELKFARKYFYLQQLRFTRHSVCLINNNIQSWKGEKIKTRRRTHSGACLPACMPVIDVFIN